jgi:hypothetical protein
MAPSGTMPVAASRPLRQRPSCRPQKPQRRAVNGHRTRANWVRLSKPSHGRRSEPATERRITRCRVRLKFITRNLTVMAKCIPISDLSQQE